MVTAELLWAGLKAFIIALVLTPILRDIFLAYNVVDRPGRRKVHAHPIPRVGGIPIAIAYVISLTSFSPTGSLPGSDSQAWRLLPSILVIFVTGLTDDFFNLRPSVKLAGQLIAAVLAFFNGLRIQTIANVEVPIWLSFLLTVFWLLLTTNALNLIDGLDGLCAGMGLTAATAMFAAALVQQNYPLAHATFPLAGALVGFLCFNFNPATVFLGDSGALMIGFLLGCFGMVWTGKTATLLGFTTPLLVLAIPLLDVSLSIVRRSLRQQPIFSADRGHIHHRLLDRGLSTRRVVLTLYLAAALSAMFGLFIANSAFKRIQGVFVLAFFAFAWAGIRQLRYAEFDMARKFLFAGGLRKTLAAKIRLQHLSASLHQAPTEAEWWNVLIASSKDSGWVRVRWMIAGSLLHEAQLTAVPASWAFEISLGQHGSIRIDGNGDSVVKFDLIELADVLRTSCPGNSRVDAAGVPH